MTTIQLNLVKSPACRMWTETYGSSGADEIVTMIQDWLATVQDNLKNTEKYKGAIGKSKLRGR